MKKILIALLLLAPWLAKASDDSVPIDVEVSSVSSDGTSDRLVYLLKEKIRESKGLRLTSSETVSHIRLRVNAMRVGSSASLALSLVWTQTVPTQGFEPYLYSTVGISVVNAEEVIVPSILAQTEKTGEELRAIIVKLHKQPNS